MIHHPAARIAKPPLWRDQTAVILLALGLMTVPGFRAILAAAAEDLAPPATTNLVRIGIAPGTWGGVNRNDASAAIAAWAKIIMLQRGMTLDVETKLFESDEDMSQALRSGRVDAVSMLSHQFLHLEPRLQPDTVFLASKNHSFQERYVLLVHRASGIENVGGLRGGKLLVENSARTSLAPQWLETLLARQSLAPAAQFFKSMSRIDNPSKVVLQVFFHQAEACVVTTNVFALSGELNPQVHKELKVLAVSPEVVPSLFYFRPDHTSRVREQLEPAILSLHEQPAGLQVLTVFQCERMGRYPVSCFDGTRELLSDYERVKKTPGGSVKRSTLEHERTHETTGDP